MGSRHVPSSYRGDSVSLKRLSESHDLIRFGRDPNLHSRIDQVLQTDPYR